MTVTMKEGLKSVLLATQGARNVPEQILINALIVGFLKIELINRPP